MKKTQKQIIKSELLNNGYVSRNWCLRNYISRLGARISDLRKEGMKIEGSYEITKKGKDYIYKLEQ